MRRFVILVILASLIGATVPVHAGELAKRFEGTASFCMHGTIWGLSERLLGGFDPSEPFPFITAIFETGNGTITLLDEATVFVPIGNKKPTAYYQISTPIDHGLGPVVLVDAYSSTARGKISLDRFLCYGP